MGRDGAWVGRGGLGPDSWSCWKELDAEMESPSMSNRVACWMQGYQRLHARDRGIPTRAMEGELCQAHPFDSKARRAILLGSA